MNINKPVILCVDDERVILTSLMDQLLYFLDDQYTIEIAESGEEALEVFEACFARGIEVPLIISDQIMPGMKGDELLITIHLRYPQALKIFLTGQADANAVGNALNHADLYRYIAKPWDEADFKLTISEALTTYQQAKQLAAQQKQLAHALDQERIAREALRQANAELEQRVAVRTAELAHANARLQEDLAQRKLMEHALRQAKEAAEAANLAKNAFLSNMSHELRTPLNVILGFTQLMAHSPELSPEFEENLGVIMRSGEHLLALINQVLDLSKMEVGKMSLHETTVDLHQLLAETFEVFRLPAAQKGLRLQFDRPPGVPRYVHTDEVKLRQVLFNLLDNALKFTPAGNVTLRVRSQECKRDALTGQNAALILRFEVEDTGPGIAPEELDALFEVFVQTKTGQHLQEGTGLGLSLSRKFVRLMGGDMMIHSEVGRGATVSFEIQAHPTMDIPVPPFKSQQHVQALAPDQPRYRILLVDNSWDSRRFLVKLLEPIGFELREAENGQEALHIWAHWQPHLIWMDWGMTGMDGSETAKRIRAEELRRQPLPDIASDSQKTVLIAALTNSFDEEQTLTLAAGCDDFLCKPFCATDILELLHKHLGVRYVYAEPPVIPASPPHAQPMLTSAALAALSDDLRVNLQQAVEAINLEQTNRLIARIRSQNAPLADALTALVKHYRFDVLQELFEKLNG